MLTRPIVVGALALVLPALASAQAPLAHPGTTGPAAVVFANGGVGSPLTDLNESGSADLKSGWTAGGGIGVQLNRYLAVRGVFDFLRTKGEDNSIAYAGEKFNQYFYGADLQLRYPTETGYAPYLIAGAGAVTTENKDDDTFDRATKFAGKGGRGVEYTFPDHGLGVFVQGATYVYTSDQDGFDKTQVDLLWTAGFSHRFGL